jgi:hypothetical protein
MSGRSAYLGVLRRGVGLVVVVALACAGTGAAENWLEATAVEEVDSAFAAPAYFSDGRNRSGWLSGLAAVFNRPNLPEGPRLPEPMVFDLVRGLGARRGELEVNVLNLASIPSGNREYEWAPEIEYAIFDGFAVEYEIPVEETKVLGHKFAAQYTFGTAFDDAFIHGVQGIAFFNTRSGEFTPTILYVAGVRFDPTWSLLGMFGGSVGSQTFPFGEEPPATGTDLITNVSLFANATEHVVFGVETNYSRQLRGPAEILVIPQVHLELTRRLRLQFGYGLRDDVEGRQGELGFRAI